MSLDQSTPRPVFSSKRNFQVWHYTVSHRQLLLRSVKSKEATTRIDILFKDVSSICLQSSFDDIRIDEVGLKSLEVPFIVSEVPTDHKLFRFKTKTSTGFVSALAFFVAEDEGEYYEDSPLIPGTF